MARQVLSLFALNRGIISRYGLSRVDIKRLGLAAETMTNWMPRVLGNMTLRPGFRYLGATYGNNPTKMIPFIFATDDTALIELTNTVMRVWINDTLLTRPAVSSAITNGDFSAKTTTTATISNGAPGVVTYVGADVFANDDPVVFTTTGTLPSPLVVDTVYYVVNVNAGANTFNVALTAGGAAITTTTAGAGVHTVAASALLTGWTDGDEGAAQSTWVVGNYMQLVGTGTDYAIRTQQVVVAAADIGVEHGVRVTIANGPVIIRIGSASGDDSYLTETHLDTGVHSLSVHATGDFWIQFKSNLLRKVTVSGCTIEAAGVVTVPTPWQTAYLSKVRYDQSADIVYVACDGLQQRRISRRGTRPGARSWSVDLYRSDNGPFDILNTTPTTLAPSGLSGNITITSSKPLFKSTHVGALFAITSVGQTVTKSSAASATSTDSIRVSGVTAARDIGITITGDASGSTVTLERSFDNLTWGAVGGIYIWTADATTSYNDALANQIAYYRLTLTTRVAPDTVVMTLTYSAGSIRGVARVTAATNTNLVSAEVLKSMGGTAASASWEEGQWSDKHGWPTAVRFQEGRLWWSGSNAVWGSVSDAYDSFDPTYLGDAGPINRTIGSGPVDTINWMLGLQRLVLGAQGAEISAKSSSLDEPLTPTNFNLKTCSTQGSGNVDALKIDQTAVFVNRSGARLYELALSVQQYDYQAQDLTALVTELGRAGIVRIAVQRQPDTRIHCIKNDGTVMILVRDRVEDVQAWVEIDAGSSVVAVPPAVVDPRPPLPSPDPHWGDVLLLLNGTGAVTKDSSSFNRALGATGVALSTTQTLFGLPTYKVGTVGDMLQGLDPISWFPTAVGAGEWCDERWVFITSTVGTGQMAYYANTILQDYRNSHPGEVSATATDIGSSSINAAGGVGFSLNAWHHIAFVRDNTTDPTFGYVKLYVDGINVSSAGGFAKTDIYGTSVSWAVFIGWINPATAALGYQTQVRLTRGTARYYANFSVPTASFPTS